MQKITASSYHHRPPNLCSLSASCCLAFSWHSRAKPCANQVSLCLHLCKPGKARDPSFPTTQIASLAWHLEERKTISSLLAQCDFIVQLKGDTTVARVQELVAGILHSLNEWERCCVVGGSPMVVLHPDVASEFTGDRQMNIHPTAMNQGKEASQFSVHLGKISQQHPCLFGCEL